MLHKSAFKVKIYDSEGPQPQDNGVIYNVSTKKNYNNNSKIQ